MTKALPTHHRMLAFVAALGIVSIGGCSKPVEKPTGVLPAYQQKALEKAHNTGQVLQDATDRRHQEMDKQGI